MDEPVEIGLPPPVDAPRPAVTSGSLWHARAVNVIGLVTPAANLGLLLVGPPGTRWFGLGAGVACGAAFVIGHHTDRPALEQAAWTLHYALVAIGLVHPLAIVPIARAWTKFGELLGKAMVYPLFGIVWYVVVTPTALLMRAFGKDPLNRKAPPGASYWVAHGPVAKERYERQF